jgi:hypothetical protein
MSDLDLLATQTRLVIRQSLHERFDIRSTAFLMAVLSDLMVQRFKPAAGVLEPTSIRRIIIEDASGHVMPKSNAENFPARGNHHGATAGVKIDLACDLLAGQFIKAPDIATLLDFDPYPDHVMRDKRHRRSPVESGIRALT